MANRFYILNDTDDTVVVYDFDGNLQSSENFSIISGTSRGIVASDSLIYIVDDTNNRARAYKFDGTRQSGSDLVLGNVTWVGGIKTSNRVLFLGGGRGNAYDFNGNRQSDDDLVFAGAGTITGGAVTTNRIYLVDTSSNSAKAWDFSGTRQSSDDINLAAAATWLGAFASDDRIYFIRHETTTAQAWDFSGTRQSSDDINLTSGKIWSGGTTQFDTSPVATLTFAETTVRNGRTVTATLTADKDATGVQLSDFSAVAGTTNLTVSNIQTVTANRSWTVDVTAPATGTGNITLTFAADGFAEGNVAATATVAHKPLPTFAITFALDKAFPSVAVQATATASEDVTDMELADFSVDVGTVGNFNKVSNTVYTVDVTPPTGPNTVTLTLRQDAAAEGNAETTGQITSEPFTMTFAEVPTGTTDNTFTCELRPSHAISGLSKGDILLFRVSGSDSNSNITNLNNAQLIITAIDGTTHHRLALALTGTYNGVYRMRMRVNSVSAGGQNFPATLLLSDTFRIDSSYVPPLPAPSTPTNLTATAVDSNRIRLNFGASTGTVTEYQERHATTQAGLSSATWNDAGTSTTIIVDNLPPSTTHYFQVRAGNQNVYSGVSNTATATTPAFVAVSIQQFGIQNIPVGTENYELEIEVTGNPDKVGAVGDWEEFYGHWDATAERFYIRADTVLILKDGASWAIEAVKNNQPTMGTIQYNVISNLPVIVDPGRLYFFRGLENNKFVEVSNVPSAVRVRGDLVGLLANPSSTEDAEGIGITGIPNATAVFRDDLNATLHAENGAGAVELDKSFEVLDEPNLYVRVSNNTPRIARIARTHKDTPNDTESAIYAFDLAVPVEPAGFTADSFLDIKCLGEFIYALLTASSVNIIAKYVKDTVENNPGDILETWTLPSVISDPRTFLPSATANFIVVDTLNRRIHHLRPNNADATQLDSWLHSQLPSAYANVSGLYLESSAAYILDQTDRRIGVINDGNLAAVNTTFDREFSIPSSVQRPVSLYVDDTYCYLCDYFAQGTTAKAQVIRVAKNTANGQTATIERAFGVGGSNLIFPSGLFIDE